MKEQNHETRKNHQTRDNFRKQLTAVLAALMMTAVMGVCIVAIGGSAVLNGSASNAVSQVVAILTH